MDNNSLRSRFKDAPWFQTAGENMIIGGAGGIGSWLTVLLTRAGYQPFVFDFDVVEAHNIGGQLFKKGQIGMFKVEALKTNVVEFSDLDIQVFNEAFTSTTMGYKFMFSAFDNMKARQDMFKVWKQHALNCPDAIFIDGRLLMEQMQIFCVTPSNMDEYEKEHLFDDSEVEDANCTLKQTSHSASMIASLMVGFFTNHMTNIVNNDKGRQLPFMYEYFIPVNLVSES